MKDSLAWLYDSIDAGLARSEFDAQLWGYPLYWLTTALLLILSANLMTLTARECLIRLPLPDVEGFSRDQRGMRLALQYFPDRATPRSELASSHLNHSRRGERRRYELAKALQRPSPLVTLRRVAYLQRCKDTVEELILKVTVPFGGAFYVLPRLRTAARPGVILGSLIAVLWVRPLWSASQLAQAFTRLSKTALGDTALRLLPVVLLLLAFALVARRAPFVDTIRARDEAAKEANRLLGELSSRIEQLCYAVPEWRRDLGSKRELLLDKWVWRVSNNRYMWSLSGGVVEIEERTFALPGPLPPSLDLDEASQPLNRLVREVAALQQRIQDSGTYPVVTGVAHSRSYRRLRLDYNYFRGDPEKALRQTFHAPKEVLSLLTDEGGLPTPPPPDAMEAVSDYYKKRLEVGAYNVMRVLDYYVCDLCLKEADLRRMLRLLRRRIVGSWWTRMASVVYR